MPRILIIKMSSLGDVFHALPAVRCLKTGLNASVDWVVHDAYVELVKCFEDVDRVISFPRENVWTGFTKFRAELRQNSYDYIVDLQGLLKSAFVARMARGGRILGPSFQREGARFLYDAVVGERDKNRHAVDECLDVVRFLGLQLSEPAFPVKFPARPRVEPHPRVAMLPCSRRPDKNWPPVRFVEVGRALMEKSGASTFLVGAPADADACREIESALPGGVINLCGKTSLVELGSLLREMDLLVTVDSGPMHMAAALGVPVVAVFGPTFPQRTGPFGSRHRVIKQSEALSVLPAEPVVAAAVEILNQRGRS